MRTMFLPVILTGLMMCLGAPAQAQEESIKLSFRDPAHSTRLLDNWRFEIMGEGRTHQVNSLYNEDETADSVELTARITLTLYKTKWVHPGLVLQVGGSYQSTDLTGTNDLDELFDQRQAYILGGLRLTSDVVYLWDGGPQMTYDVVVVAGYAERKMLQTDNLFVLQIDAYGAIRLTNSHLGFYARSRNRWGWEQNGQLAETYSRSFAGVNFTFDGIKIEVGVGGGLVGHGDEDNGGQRSPNGDYHESFVDTPFVGAEFNLDLGPISLNIWGGYSDWVAGDIDDSVHRDTDETSGFLGGFGLKGSF